MTKKDIVKNLLRENTCKKCAYSLRVTGIPTPSWECIECGSGSDLPEENTCLYFQKKTRLSLKEWKLKDD